MSWLLGDDAVGSSSRYSLWERLSECVCDCVCVCVRVDEGRHPEFYLSVALTCLSLTASHTHWLSHTDSEPFLSARRQGLVCVECSCWLCICDLLWWACVCWGEGSYKGFMLISSLMEPLHVWDCVWETDTDRWRTLCSDSITPDLNFQRKIFVFLSSLER